LIERLEFDLRFCWFVGIGVDDAAWDHSTFSKNRERLLEGDIAAKLLSAVLSQPRMKRLLSTDHFSVDGTLIGGHQRRHQRRRRPDTRQAGE
jgi:transposase